MAKRKELNVTNGYSLRKYEKPIFPITEMTRKTGRVVLEALYMPIRMLDNVSTMARGRIIRKR